MGWRRQKVKELFSRGYAQNDIANTLHISQPTISRDLHYIKRAIRKNQERNVERYNEAHWTMLMGLEEAIKKLWTIIDSSKTDDRERIKAIILVMQYYKDKLEMIRSEVDLPQYKKFVETAKIFDP